MHQAVSGFHGDPSSGSEGLLESIEIYLEQVGRKRKELDRLEKYLNGIRRTLSGQGNCFRFNDRRVKAVFRSIGCRIVLPDRSEQPEKEGIVM